MAEILVIDDDTSLLQMMSIMLKRAGHNPTLASEARQGIAIAQRDIPDLAIIDVMMPDLSGYEVCAALRKDPATRNIPLLMLTALSQSEHRGKAEDSGADAFVTKPVTRDDLVKHVDELLRVGARNFPDFTDQLPSLPETPAAPAEPQPAPPPGFEAASPAAPAPPVPAAPPARPASVGTSFTPHTVALPLVVVVGLGTGVGATTISINLALALMQYGRVCLLDFNYKVGKAADQLRANPRGTWRNLMSYAAGGDKRIIGAALTAGHPSGLALIAAPSAPTPDRLSPATLSALFPTLAEGFRRIVVDLPLEMDTMSIATLNAANHVVVVLGNDPTGLPSAHSMLSAVDAMRLPGQVHMVLNHSKPEGISYEAAMAAVNSPLAADIPYETAQADCLSTGRPLLMSQPASLFSRTVLHLARLL